MPQSISHDIPNFLLQQFDREVILCDAEGLILFVSDNLADRLSYASEDLLAQPLNTILVEEQVERSADAIQHGDCVLLLKDRQGALNPFRCEIIDDPVNGHRLIKLFETVEPDGRHDLQFQLLAENMQDMVSLHDAEGRFTWISPSVEYLLGYKPRELIGNSPEDLIHPDDQRSTWVKIMGSGRKLPDERRQIRTDQRIREKNGTYRWVETISKPVYDSDNTLIGILSTSRDVSAQKEILKKLAHKVGFEELITRISSKFIDIQPGDIDKQIEWGLEQITTFFGVHRSYIYQYVRGNEMVQRTHSFTDEGYETNYAQKLELDISKLAYFQQQITNGKPVYWSNVTELSDDKKAEREFFSSFGIKSMFVLPLTYMGTVCGFLGFNSIAEEKEWQEEYTTLLKVAGEIFMSAIMRKKSDERRNRLIRKIERTNHELEDFAYVVSHDLKAPLRGIGSLASWLHEDYHDKLGEAGREQLDLLKGRVERMNRLIDGILEYSRLGRRRDELEEVDITDVISVVTESIITDEDATVHLDTPMPVITADRIRIEQLFQNLISNSLKYNDKESCRIRVGAEKENDFWRFYVSDNGPGIDPKYFDKVFKIFQTLQVRDEDENTGVGLTLVKKIVQHYGGSVWLESEPGEGVTFYFTLPVSLESREEY